MKLSFAPSSYSRWGRCTASPAAIAGKKAQDKAVTGWLKQVLVGAGLEGETLDSAMKKLSEGESDYATEGVVAHELHAYCLTWECTARSMIGETLMVNSEIGEVVIDAEMAEHVDDSIQYVFDHTDPDKSLGVEFKVSLDHLIPDQTGICDVSQFCENGTVLKIIDLKFGKGIQVFAKQNSELMLHASGALRSLSVAERSKVKTIELHISQPRLEHYDKWELTPGDISQFELEVVSKYNEAIDPERRKFLPTPEGCQFCPLKTDCRALKDGVYGMVMGDEGDELVDPERMTHAELAAMYEWFDFISAWAKNAKEHMTKLADSGVTFPGLKLIPGKSGAREWVSEEKAIKWMAESKGMSDFEIYESSLISPAKAEAQLGKKHVGAEFKELYRQNKGKPRLVPERHASESLTDSQINDFNDV